MPVWQCNQPDRHNTPFSSSHTVMSEEALRLQIQNLKKHNARLKRIAHDARTKLNAALDGTGLFLWQLDIPSGKLVIFNRRWGAMLGFQPKACRTSAASSGCRLSFQDSKLASVSFGWKPSIAPQRRLKITSLPLGISSCHRNSPRESALLRGSAPHDRQKWQHYVGAGSGPGQRMECARRAG